MNAKINESLVGKMFTCLSDGVFLEGKSLVLIHPSTIKSSITVAMRNGKLFVFEDKTKDITKQVDPKTYKDWQVGDKITNGNNNDAEVIVRSGRVVVFEENNYASTNYTCDELFNKGWRLNIPIIPKEPKILELTLDEIALKYGLSVSQIKIKK